MSHTVSAVACGMQVGVTHTAAVVGQLARDLVLSVDRLPETGTAGDADGRREQLGGKGANQAVALAQLGVRPSLVAVAGDDVIGDVLLDQARRDGINVTAVIRRRGVLTGLIVELLDADGGWRYVQDLPEPVLLTERDVQAATHVIGRAEAVLVQLQQPAPAALAAAKIGHNAGRLVVLDGAPQAARDELLALADVVRADQHEASLLLDALDPDSVRRLLSHGPRLIAVALPDGANRFVWADGDVVVPAADEKVVDTTGGGDALVAALTDALLRGVGYREAAAWASAAAAATVGHPSGRPSLIPADLEKRARQIK
jgi:ribokinase